jgi:hypothetical protein
VAVQNNVRSNLALVLLSERGELSAHANPPKIAPATFMFSISMSVAGTTHANDAGMVSRSLLSTVA